MNKTDTMSAAVCEVIDAYPTGHEFYGNQLKDDVVRIYPNAIDMYPDSILRMARRHRRYAFCVVNKNDSLYKKLSVIPIIEQIKESAPKPEPPVTHRLPTRSVQGFLFSFLLFAIIITGFLHNNRKTPEALSDWIVENGKILLFSQNIFEKSLSIAQKRHDYFGMSGRTIFREPGKPSTISGITEVLA